MVLATLGPGDCVGERSLIDSQSHSASVFAEVPTDALALGQLKFAHCMPEGDFMAHAVLRGLVQRLRHADRQIDSLALMDVYGRVARVLLNCVKENARCAEGHAVIPGQMSRQDLTKRVDALREMVSRVMNGLEGRGFIVMPGDGALLVKPHLDSLV